MTMTINNSLVFVRSIDYSKAPMPNAMINSDLSRHFHLQVTFYVLPHKDLGYKSFKRERLVANDFLQIRKVIEHVYEKVICNGSEAGSSAAGSPTGGGGGNNDRDQQQQQQAGDDSGSLAEERVELLCNDQVLDPNLDLRTVRQCIWKSTNEDLVLNYKPIRGS